jgi:GNAT superfamily N-acetyltransferase
MPDDLVLAAREATAADLDSLLGLYRSLEAEQVALKGMWALADGLAEPADRSLAALVADPSAVVVIGEIEGYPFGFVAARIEPLLPQAAGEEVGAIRLIFTEEPARGVGLGETMINAMLSLLRARGLTRFDAHVLPGHRMAKNFFEASGFAARSIVMHHEDG